MSDIVNNINPNAVDEDSMDDFKKEMEIEPFAKLWNTREYYENLYKDKV